MTTTERARYAAACYHAQAVARKTGRPYIKPIRPDERKDEPMMNQANRIPTNQKQKKYDHDEIARCIVRTRVSTLQLDHIHDYLTSIRSKSPTASVFSDLLMEVMERLDDVEQALMNMQ